MAKRYFDTNLHGKVWFRSLPWRIRESWRILSAECDLIGIWEIDLPGLNLSLNIEKGSPDWVTLEDLLKAFGKRLKHVEDDKLFITGFIAFQYGDESGEISPKNKLLPKLTRMLKARGLPPPCIQDTNPKHPPSVSDVSPMGGVKEEDKEEDKDIKGEFEGKDVARFENRFKFDFIALFDRYPRSQKKTQSLALLAENVSSQATYDQVAQAIDRYRAHCEKLGTEPNFVLTFPNFWNEWTDWLDPRAGVQPSAKQQRANLGEVATQIWHSLEKGFTDQALFDLAERIGESTLREFHRDDFRQGGAVVQLIKKAMEEAS